jgi:hypothetical protein
MTIERAKALAHETLSDTETRELFSHKGIDVERLSAPSAEWHGELVLVDFRDDLQNISIVVIVKPDGRTEISSIALDR